MSTFQEPAFPVPGLQHDSDFNGMTLRDYFAAKAMQEILSKCIQMDSRYGGIQYAREFAKYAYMMADEMIAERAK